MIQSLVSVIIPVKNGARYLREAIGAVLSQDYVPIEVIVVDGQSADETAAVAKSFPQVRYISEKEPPSIANARNLGIAAAAGEYIAMISCDDLWAPDKIAAQVEKLTENPRLQYAVCQVRFFLEDGQIPPQGFRKELLQKDVVGHMPETMLARKTLFEAIGGFDPTYGLAEDLEWFHRLRIAGVPMIVVPRPLVLKRVHSQTLSFGSSESARDIRAFLRRSVLNRRMEAHRKAGPDCVSTPTSGEDAE